MNKRAILEKTQHKRRGALNKEFRLFSILLVLPVLLSLFLSSCAAPTRGDLLKKFEKNPELGSYIRDVPFYPHEEFMCGPASLMSILNYYSFGYDLDEVAAAVFVEKIQGTLMMDMLIYAKLKGFNAQVYKSGPFDLKARLRQKQPMILFLNLGSKEKPLGHFIVAIGFDDETKTLIAHSGLIRAQIFPYKTVMEDWRKTGYSTLMITQ